MDDARKMQYGVEFDTGEANGGIDALIQKVDDLEKRLGAVEMGAQQIGASAVSACQTAQGAVEQFTGAVSEAADGLDDAGGDADEFRAKIRQAAEEAEDLGSAFRTTMADGLEAGQSITKSFGTGVTGALDFSKNKFKGFITDTVNGAKKIGTALAHPIQTIRTNLVKALRRARESEDDVGDGAEDAEKGLNDMGEAGENAGNGIKGAISGAVGAIAKFEIVKEAIKQGIELLKDFGASAIEAFSATENTSAKFDRTFSDDAAAWVDDFSDAVNRSVSEVQGFMVQNQAMYRNMGMTADAAEELSEITTSLGYDFGNAFSMDDADAAALIQSAIQGDTDALSEYGIVLDEAALKNSAAAMGLGENIDELDDAAAAQVRLNAILEQSEDIQQAAINKTGGLVNSTKSLNGVWNGFLSDAGAKFSPMLEDLFGTIMGDWPTIEPMLMSFVGVLSDGLSEAMPVVMELGQNLLPVLISVLGTLFQAATPLISVFSSLAATALPPLADILGMLGTSLLPPIVEILSTLNTSIIQPLMPVLQGIAQALLPPIAQLLGVISPILELISPVLGVIGDALGIIADFLGKTIGWLADGAGKVVDFFSGLFGGAQESAGAVEGLTGAVNDLDGAAGQKTSLAVDTSTYTKDVSTASQGATEAISEASAAAKEISDANYMKMANDAETAYARMTLDAEDAWERMTAAASDGATNIVAQFQRIASAAQSVSGADISVTGVNVPGNAEGTNDWEGGWTRMNEEGGELAYLPSGTAIIPADKTDEIINNSTTSSEYVDSSTFAPQISISIGEGGAQADPDGIAQKVQEMMEKFWREKKEEEYHRRAMQGAYAR